MECLNLITAFRVYHENNRFKNQYAAQPTPPATASIIHGLQKRAVFKFPDEKSDCNEPDQDAGNFRKHNGTVSKKIC